MPYLHPMIRRICILVAALLAIASAAPAWATDTIFLGESSNIGGTWGTANPTTWILYRVNVSTAGTVNTATARVLSDPATNTSKVAIYANAGAGSGSWSPAAQLTQASYSYNATYSAYDVTYTGSATLSTGTYWVGIVGVTGNPGFLGNSGSSTTPWAWANTTEWVTTDTGTTWSSYSTTSNAGVVLLNRVLSSSASDASTPAPWVQEIGMPADGCESVDRPDLNTNGLTGGWHKAWGEWLNDRRGGWVCHREFEYSGNAWVVR